MACHFQNYWGSQVYTHFLFKEMEMKFPLMMFQWYVKKKWYLGMAEEVSVEEKDVLVKFLHPNGP